MVQRLMDGPGVLDRLPRRDLDGRCLNAIPRTMIESRGGESIKGTVIADAELVDLGRAVVEALGVRGPVHRAGVPRPRDRPGHHRRQHALRRRLPGARCTPRCPGRTYPELIVRMAARRDGRAARRRVPRRHDLHALLLAARARRASCGPTGRDIVEPAGPPAPR